MKKLTPFIIVLAVMAAAVFTLQSFEVKTVPITGTEVNIQAFKTLNIDVPFDVYFTQGATASANVEGDKTEVDKLAFIQKGNDLTIRFKDKEKAAKGSNLKIYITCPELENVNISGSGNFYTTAPVSNSKSLNFAIAGSGNIVAGVTAPKIQVDIAGSGDAEITGKSEKVYVSIAGSGDYEGNALIANDVDVDIAGSGNAFVYAEDKVDASIAGSGDVYYSGTPESVTADVAGSGNVRPHKQ